MKSMRLLRIIGLIGIFGLFCGMATEASAKQPKTNARAYPVSTGYHKLVVSSAFEVTLCDTIRQALVTVPQSLYKQVVMEEDKGTLRIALRGKNKLRTRPKVVLPRNPNLRDVELSEAASFTADTLYGTEMKLYLTGASQFFCHLNIKEITMEFNDASQYRGTIDANNLYLNFRGSSSAEIRGRVFYKMQLKLRETSHLDAEKLEAKRIEGSMAEASHAIVWSTEWLKVPVDDASHLIYIGHPRLVECPTGAMSTVKRK